MKSDLKGYSPYKTVCYEGNSCGNKGTYAHPIIAAAYAGFLDSNLEIEVRDVWLRYRAGDAALADEILQKAPIKDNKWVAQRAMNRATRNDYTDVLKDHGVSRSGYARCTDNLYIGLFGKPTREIVADKGLPEKTNLRDEMTLVELSSTMLAEALATERIKDTDCHGNTACAGASWKSAKAVREAVESDRKSRKPE